MVSGQRTIPSESVVQSCCSSDPLGDEVGAARPAYPSLDTGSDIASRVNSCKFKLEPMVKRAFSAAGAENIPEAMFPATVIQPTQDKLRVTGRKRWNFGEGNERRVCDQECAVLKEPIRVGQ